MKNKSYELIDNFSGDGKSKLKSTGDFNEGIPNAWASAIFISHSFHLICRSCSSEDETLWKCSSAEPSSIEIDNGEIIS